jgi:hypothetical protein
MPKKWLIYPVGEHAKRLQQNVGLDHYTLLQKPEAEWSPFYLSEKVYVFHFSDIEEENVKALMVKKTSESRNISEEEALHTLLMGWQGVPVSHVKIVEVE